MFCTFQVINKQSTIAKAMQSKAERQIELSVGSNTMDNFNAYTLPPSLQDQKQLKISPEFAKIRIKRDSFVSNSTIFSRIITFVNDNVLVECNTMMKHLCPGSGIGCTICNYFSKGSCTSVCTMTDIVCNATLMRCLKRRT